MPEQAKLLGAQWKALDEKERVKFEKMATEAKAAIADAAPETKAKGKGANSEPKPKRAPSAYICANEARSKLPEGLKVPEQAKLLGAQWKTFRCGGEGEVRRDGCRCEARGKRDEIRAMRKFEGGLLS